MDRLKSLKKISKKKIWDLIIIGGGSSGLGIAVDSASRGYKTLLLEKKKKVMNMSMKVLKHQFQIMIYSTIPFFTGS